MLRQIADHKGSLQFEFDHVLSKYLLEKDDPNQFNFIQIGAFDGIECDPLRKYLVKFNWKGILLEPQTIPFSKLEKLYEGREGIKVLQAAIAEKDGIAKLYTLTGDDLPSWAKGMASFSKENILKHEEQISGIEKNIELVEVPAMQLDSLLNQYHIDQLDLLQIDAEGFDAVILNMFPFNRLKPTIIHFESKHIPKKDLENLLDKLISIGYVFASDRGEDTTCVLTN